MYSPQKSGHCFLSFLLEAIFLLNIQINPELVPVIELQTASSSPGPRVKDEPDLSQQQAAAIGLGSQVQAEGTAGAVALVLTAQGQVGLRRHRELYNALCGYSGTTVLHS